MELIKNKKETLIFIGVLAIAAALRLAGICWGLPHLYNADEPHILNLAVSFGAGTLRPYAFKYPTLWPYFLFFCFGIYFLIWSRFGTVHHVIDFAGLYALSPTGFYLIARFFSVVFSLGAVCVLYRARARYGFRWAWLFAALSPLLIYSAHEAKADSLMFFFVCLGWHYALRVFEEGKRRDHFLAALFLGLAFSSQFTALPASVALMAAHFFSREKTPRIWIFEAGAIYVAAFLIGSPYALLDFHNFWFWIHMHSLSAMGVVFPWSRWAVAAQIGDNLKNLLSLGIFAALLALMGAVSLALFNPRALFVLATPILICLVILVNNPDGGTVRYMIPIFPALAFLASQGLSVIEGLRDKYLSRTLLIAAFLSVFVPALKRAAALDQEMRLPDTRLLAERWTLQNIPQGAVILADEPSAGPRLFMTPAEIERLAERTKKSGSPRSPLYFAMVKTHLIGGYWIYRIKRSAWDLDVHHPLQVQLSQADSPMLDVSSGLAAARKAKVQYVITSSMGVDLERAPELRLFFKQLEKTGVLLREFDPVPGKIAGPVIKIYQIRR